MRAMLQSNRPVAIIPVAGRSQRMGTHKLLLPWGSGTVLESTVRALEIGAGAEIHLVCRPDDLPLQTLVRSHPESAPESAWHLSFNPNPEDGMLSTILAGLRNLDELALSERPLLITPGDLPALRPETVRAVVDALSHPMPDGRLPLLVVPAVGDRRGHPLGIAASLIPAIFQLDPAVGLRQLRQRHEDRLRMLPVDDEGSVTDVDTPERYRQLYRSTFGQDAPLIPGIST